MKKETDTVVLYWVGWQYSVKSSVDGACRVCSGCYNEGMFDFAQAVESCHRLILENENVVNAYITRSYSGCKESEVVYLCIMTDFFGHRSMPFQVCEYGLPDGVEPISNKLQLK